MRARHLRISGRVQGVGFRAFVAAVAARQGVAGWVRNRADGTVEVLVWGGAADVEAVVAACHAGPVGAFVERVIEDEAQPMEGEGFVMRETV